MANNIKTQVEDYLANEFAQYMEMVGSKSILGRIFGLLVAQPGPMSLNQMTERLNVSKPAVSTNSNLGAQLNLFEKVYVPEFPREDFYMVKVEFLESMIDPGLQKLNTLKDKLRRAMVMMEEQNTAVKGSEDEKMLYKRIQYLSDAFDIMLEEYHYFGDRIRQRLKDKRKEMSI
ncbi:MAG: GbsR/MarR family transcriptional regulator [Candidatus Kapaibacterium sp.]